MTTEELRARRSWAYENPRPDVQQLIPAQAGRILDAGCASGALGAALKTRQGAEVVGLELDPVYAQAAESRLDRVIVTDLERLPEEGLNIEGFDCLIAADVLEHMRDPWGVLRALVEALRDGGTAVVSLPNVRYWETFWALGRWGVWPRRPEGIFDSSHLRWFTRADAIALLEQAGLRVTRIAPQYRLRPGRPENGREPRILRRLPLSDLFVFQYVLAGVKPPHGSGGGSPA